MHVSTRRQQVHALCRAPRVVMKKRRYEPRTKAAEVTKRLAATSTPQSDHCYLQSNEHQPRVTRWHAPHVTGKCPVASDVDATRLTAALALRATVGIIC